MRWLFLLRRTEITEPLDNDRVVADGMRDLASASIAVDLLERERRSLNAGASRSTAITGGGPPPIPMLPAPACLATGPAPN
jgi:hypothetical protein